MHDAADSEGTGKYISQMGTEIWPYDDPKAVATLMQNSSEWKQCEAVDTMYIFQREKL